MNGIVPLLLFLPCLSLEYRKAIDFCIELPVLKGKAWESKPAETAPVNLL